MIPQRFTATQLLYRTTDLNDNASTTVTTVLTPTERTPDMPCPIVSYQCAIDAVTGRCFPSYALCRRAKAAGSLAQFELLLIVAALAEGWAVSVPDHGGPHGVFGAPFEPGYCVLDGLRAAHNFEPLQLSPSAPIGLWGYSGGGLASAWAAEMYDGYAPELSVVGAVLGSPVGDLGSTYHRLNGKFFSGLPTMVVAALMHSYPDLTRVVEDSVTVEGKALLEKLTKMTTAQAVMRLRKQDMADMLAHPLDEILNMPEVQHVFDNIRSCHRGFVSSSCHCLLTPKPVPAQPHTASSIDWVRNARESCRRHVQTDQGMECRKGAKFRCRRHECMTVGETQNVGESWGVMRKRYL